jgi:hypothetical protein
MVTTAYPRLADDLAGLERCQCAATWLDQDHAVDVVPRSRVCRRMRVDVEQTGWQVEAAFERRVNPRRHVRAVTPPAAGYRTATAITSRGTGSQRTPRPRQQNSPHQFRANHDHQLNNAL